MDIKRIVLTGGPCAGKTTGIDILRDRLASLGYKVIVLEEPATALMQSGIYPSEVGLDFQRFLIEYQLDRDKNYMNLFLTAFDKGGELYDKIVVIYDRGIMDGQAYTDGEKVFERLLDEYSLNRSTVYSKYDGVFHLVTTADGARDYYGTETNALRMESADEAIDADKLTLESWVGHNHLRVINNAGKNFERKMGELTREVMRLLGEPEPLEIERKFLIKMPDIGVLKKGYKVCKSDIVQTYLKSVDEHTERRIRQRGINGNYTYYYTEKKQLGYGTRQEIERILSEKEYIRLMAEADDKLKQIKKERYCLVYKDTYLELDIYPFLIDNAVMEIEVLDIEQNIEIPPEIEILREVTGDEKYSNYSLARR